MSLYPAKTQDQKTTEKKEKVHDLSISDLGIALIRKKDFFSYIWSELEKEAREDVDTMALAVIEGKYSMLYNPEWYKYYSIDEAQTVVAHELSHKNNNHLPQLYKILKNTPDPDRRQKILSVANIASDFEVNCQLHGDFGYRLPHCALLPQNIGFPVNKSFVWYLSELMKKADQREENGYGFSLGELAADAAMKDRGHLWIVPKDGEEGEAQEQEIRELERENKEAIKRAVEVMKEQKRAGITCGKIPGNIEQMLNTVTAAAERWDQKLKRYILQARDKSEEFKINKLSEERMMLDNGLGMHGVDEDIDKFNIVVGVDTSGSMGTDQIEEGLGIVAAVARSEDEVRVKLIQYDHHIQKISWLSNGEKIEKKIWGRGGTDFNQFFEEAIHSKRSKKRFRADLIVNFTDGFAPAVNYSLIKAAGRTPVLWVLTRNGQNPHKNWGKEIRMKK